MLTDSLCQRISVCIECLFLSNGQCLSPFYPSSSPYTFHPSGFYRTLKSRVAKVLSQVGTGPTQKMLLMQDGIAAAFVYAFAMTCLTGSYWVAAIAGTYIENELICHNCYSLASSNQK